MADVTPIRAHHGHVVDATDDRLAAERQALDTPLPGSLPALDVAVVSEGGVTVCRPIGEIDASTVESFRSALADAAGPGPVVVDLSAVPFMDSAGLGALIGGVRRTREAGGDVAVACDRPTVLKLLHTTGFDRIVEVSDSVVAARSILLA